LDVYTSIFITMGAASTALILRLMARRMTKVPLWYDDYFAVVAFVSARGSDSHESQISDYICICDRIDFDLEMFAVAYCTAVTVCKTPFPSRGIRNPHVYSN
jgi:hypothetical protein